jgi:hypothetical protein
VPSFSRIEISSATRSFTAGSLRDFSVDQTAPEDWIVAGDPLTGEVDAAYPGRSSPLGSVRGGVNSSSVNLYTSSKTMIQGTPLFLPCQVARKKPTRTIGAKASLITKSAQFAHFIMRDREGRPRHEGSRVELDAPVESLVPNAAAECSALRMVVHAK